MRLTEGRLSDSLLYVSIEVRRLPGKKISRNYRVTPLFDLIVKRCAKQLKMSEIELIEACVLGKAEDLLRVHKALAYFAQSTDPEIAKLIQLARIDLVRRWQKL